MCLTTTSSPSPASCSGPTGTPTRCCVGGAGGSRMTGAVRRRNPTAEAFMRTFVPARMRLTRVTFIVLCCVACIFVVDESVEWLAGGGRAVHPMTLLVVKPDDPPGGQVARVRPRLQVRPRRLFPFLPQGPTPASHHPYCSHQLV